MRGPSTTPPSSKDSLCGLGRGNSPLGTTDILGRMRALLLESVHRRWVAILRSMSATDFDRTLRHPDHGTINLNQLLCLYAWHGRHHVAHVTSLRERMGW